MNELKVENFGPIGKAHVEFGDLTILVGAQASGKSLFLELLNGENGAFPPTRDGCIHSLSMRKRG